MTGHVTPNGWLFIGLVSVGVPVLAVRSALKVRAAGRSPTRGQYFTSVAISQIAMLFLALTTARYEGVRLFPRPHADAASSVFAAVFLALALGTFPWRWGLKPLDERRRQLWIFPHSTRDLWWWAAVAVTAGFVEEILYRGVLFTLWYRIVAYWPAAVVICVVVFALAHYVQGWRAMAVIVLFSVFFHGIVRITGDLYTAMAVHALYDFGAGVIAIRLIARDGLVRGPAAPEPAPVEPGLS